MVVSILFKKLHDSAVVPEYKSARAAGADLYSVSNHRMSPGQVAVVSLGFAVNIPAGYEIQIRPRSGLAAKHGITVLNSPGTIDSDYRGEIMVILANLGQSEFIVNVGDRIAQAVVAQVPVVQFEVVSELNTTERGEDGFGSTGK